MLTDARSRSVARHPVRVLIALDYGQQGYDWAKKVREALENGADTHSIAYYELDEVKPVEWSHIRNYLNSHPSKPNRDIYKQLKAAYDRLDHDSVTFHELAEMVGDFL